MNKFCIIGFLFPLLIACTPETESNISCEEAGIGFLSISNQMPTKLQFRNEQSDTDFTLKAGETSEHYAYKAGRVEFSVRSANGDIDTKVYVELEQCEVKSFTLSQENLPCFDEELLIGKWKEVGTLTYYTYDSDYTGKAWDEDGEISEEATTFRWSLNQATLTQFHLIPIVSAEVPKVYTVTELTATSLKYKDDLSNEYSFIKERGPSVFEEKLLLGKWNEINTQVYYTYFPDHTGKVWDEAEDVNAKEAVDFYWSLDQFTLTQSYIAPIVGGEASKTYIIIELTENSLKYKDDTGKEYAFKNLSYFDESLLIGKWQEVGTEVFYTYASDYTGKIWDEANDITEAEAQPFTWSLDQINLTQIHIIPGLDAPVPKVYTITELTENSLKYMDAFGKEFSFNKVN